MQAQHKINCNCKVGNQAEDGLSATGRNPKEKVTRDQNQTESDQTRSGTQNGERVENSSPHLKRAYTAREYNLGNWPRFLVVESLKAVKTLATVIARSIAGNAGTVKSVRNTRVGTLLVEVEKRQQCTNLLFMEHLGKLEVKISPHMCLNSSKGVIKWRDLVGTPVEEIAEELSESGVTEVCQIGSKETGIYVLTCDMPTPPQHVKCAYIRLPVEEYVPNPMRCFKCQKYGHTMNKCNSQALCARC